MASSTQSSSSAETPAYSQCVDPADLDSFINYEQIYPSPSISPSTARAQAIARPTSATASSNNTFVPSSSSQTFSAPSHQYASYRQQTGFPMGAIANTMAITQNMTYRNNDMSMTNDYLDLNTSDGMFDFNALPAGMDLEFDTSPSDPAFFFPDSNEFIDPSTIGGDRPTPRPQSSNIVPSQPAVPRLYPGMHSQQAQAKAQLQKQQQQLREQNKQSSQPRQSQAQDPIVEAKISQLLNSMRKGDVRHSSISSDGDIASPGGMLPHLAKLKKEEDEMDEDERLLASEEGKKLSSKERRQLRNKVSARAFRSRRKEYIGQLEGEVAAKNSELSNVRAENQALREENTRLSDLTKMLLSSPAFSTFLDTLSQNPSAIQEQPTTTEVTETEDPRPNPRKDINPYTMAQQHQGGPQIGMALIPDQTTNFSSWGLPGWANNQMAFSVLELPEGPAVDQIDTSILSGKSSSSIESIFGSEGKDELPVIEAMPSTESVPKEVDTTEITSSDVDESDPVFALFADSPNQDPEAELSGDLFGGLHFEKVFARIVVPLDSSSTTCEEVSPEAMARFTKICSSLEAASARIDSLTARLL